LRADLCFAVHVYKLPYAALYVSVSKPIESGFGETAKLADVFHIASVLLAYVSNHTLTLYCVKHYMRLADER
jgi:hypothetical protein